MESRNRTSLAWLLVEFAAPQMDEGCRSWLCAQIGAGDTDVAIFEALKFYARSATVLPRALVGRVESWAAGYVGSDLEQRIRPVLDRIIPAGGSHHNRSAAPAFAELTGRRVRFTPAE